MRFTFIFLFISIVGLLQGQSVNDHPTEGYASFYSSKYIGARTYSGEKYDKNKLTAAHPTLPMNTKVQVTDISTGKSVVVRINDRMGRGSKRIIDLSHKAAASIGLDKRKGISNVKLTVLN